MMTRRAGAVIPRRTADGHVLVGRRTHNARSYPEYLAFPGGGVDDADARLPLMMGDTVAQENTARACAMRELGEETGRWLLCTTNGQPLGPDEKTAFRDAFCADADLGQLLAAAGAVLDDRQLVALGEWVTSDARPKRFYVRQFLLHTDDADPSLVMTSCLDELSGVRWCAPERILSAWKSGEELLLPPIRHVVRTLTKTAAPDLDDLVARLKRVRPEAVPETHDIIDGLFIQPYRTPTLAPATHTNTVLVGCRDFFIIDPATPYDDEQQSFDALMAMFSAQGRKPRAVLTTHHHPDHIGDVERVCRKYQLPLWADPVTAETLGGADRILKAGDVLTADGGLRSLQVFETPGHADGHLCYFETQTRTLIAGDMVATIGSILIDPPEGKMGVYLQSLQALVDLDVAAVIPSHGPLIKSGRAKLEAQIAHRQARQASVLQALRGRTDASPIDLVPDIYGADTPKAMWPFAARSVLAALELLVEQGHAQRAGERFSSV